MECLERLELPVYPPLARSGRFTGMLTVRVVLSHQLAVQNIEHDFQSKIPRAAELFTESADKAIKNSRFSGTWRREDHYARLSLRA